MRCYWVHYVDEGAFIVRAYADSVWDIVGACGRRSGLSEDLCGAFSETLVGSCGCRSTPFWSYFGLVCLVSFFFGLNFRLYFVVSFWTLA